MSRVRWVALMLAIIACAAAQACGGGGIESQVPDAQADRVGAPDGEDDGTGWPEASPDADVLRQEADESPGEMPEVEAPSDLPDEGPTGCPGGVGCPCDGHADCNSGFCTDTMDGRACSTACTDESSCPKGWACSIVSSGTDTMLACTAPANLCRPCRTDADCADETTPGHSHCIEQGPEGSFCGIECSADRPCPDGFDCVDVESDGRDAVRQCRPADAAPCPCSARFKEKGFLTVCWQENEAGRCEAERTCDEECSAAVPAAEVCNGIDDDCDGPTDEEVPQVDCPLENAYGTCTGKTFCIGGVEDCKGTYASQEACKNAVDDDCDGATDEEDALGCDDFFRDADEDGFGVDGDVVCLCAPLSPYVATKGGDCDDGAAAAFPGGTETCDGFDNDCNGLKDDGLPSLPCDIVNAHGTCPGVTECSAGSEYCVGTAPAPETCNGHDDDCNGVADPPDSGGCDQWHADRDGDGSGSDIEVACLCKASAPFVAAAGGDCRDDDGTVRPGALETCDGKDNDCDGDVDEGLSGLPCDLTNEYGTCPGVTSCTGAIGTCQGTWPAAEACDGDDDDCDGDVDEGCVATRVVLGGFATAYVTGQSGGIRVRSVTGQPSPVGRLPASGGGPGVCLGIACGM